MRYGRVGLAVIALASLAVGPAQPVLRVAASPPPRPPYWPPPVLSRERALLETVRVDSRGGGAFDTGTGVAVGANVVLTNRHLTTNPVTLVTACGDQLRAVDRIELADRGVDVAAVVTGGSNLLPVELADHDPVAGDTVLMVGYPGGDLTVTEGRVEGTLNEPGGLELRFSPEPRAGQSGSPLLDANGRLAGLVFADEATGGQGLAIPASRLRSLLEQFTSTGVPVAPLDTGDPAVVRARSSPCH